MIKDKLSAFFNNVAGMDLVYLGVFIFVALVSLAGMMVIGAICYRADVEENYVSRIAAANQHIVGQRFTPIDIDMLPPELPADHYLDRDLAVNNLVPGSPAPPECVLLTDREYEIAKRCYLPNDISPREYKKLKMQLMAIYRAGGFGYANIEETINWGN